MTQYDKQEVAGDELDILEAELDYGSSREPASGGVNWGMMIGLLVAMVAVGFIVVDGLKSETYFYSVDEAVDRGDALVGKTVRVKGVVMAGTINGAPGELGYNFRIAEQGKSMRITYSRALPDTFQEGTEVVAQGRVDETLTLDADEVLVKCPSRYEGAPPTAHEGPGPQAAR